MHLSSQEEYGLRCLMQVVQHRGDAPLGVNEIARAEGLSAEYAAKLMRILRQGGLVQSVRGANGGYRLAREANEVTVREALEVLGGPMFSDTVCSGHSGQHEDCVHTSGSCSIRALWSWIGGTVKDALDGVTLATLARPESVVANGLVQLPADRRPRFIP